MACLFTSGLMRLCAQCAGSQTVGWLAALSADDQADDVIVVFVGRADLESFLMMVTFTSLVCSSGL